MYLFYDSIHENQAYYTIYASSYMYGLCKYNVDESIVRFEFGYPDWASKKIKRIYPEEGATYDVLCEQVKKLKLPIWDNTENTVDISTIFGRIELHIEKNGDFKLGGYSYLLLLNSEILGKLEIIDPEAPVLRRQKKPFFISFQRSVSFLEKI